VLKLICKDSLWKVKFKFNSIIFSGCITPTKISISTYPIIFNQIRSLKPFLPSESISKSKLKRCQTKVAAFRLSITTKIMKLSQVKIKDKS
jgi:hypothetical protein